MKTREYMKGRRFSTYEAPGSTVQLRDNKPAKDFPAAGIVAVFPTLGGGFSTSQSPAQAVRLARKICRLLNK